MDDLADLYRQKLNLPNAIFTYIDHEVSCPCLTQSLSPQYIIDCLNTNYGIAVITLIFLPLGADMNAAVYKAETRDGKNYYINSRCSGEFARCPREIVELGLVF